MSVQIETVHIFDNEYIYRPTFLFITYFKICVTLLHFHLRASLIAFCCVFCQEFCSQFNEIVYLSFFGS